VDRYLLPGKTMPWYAMGLSIMARQASAVTFNLHHRAVVCGWDEVRQAYFGLPIPWYHLHHGGPLFTGQNLHRVRVPGEALSDTRLRTFGQRDLLCSAGSPWELRSMRGHRAPVILGWPERTTRC